MAGGAEIAVTVGRLLEVLRVGPVDLVREDLVARLGVERDQRAIVRLEVDVVAVNGESAMLAGEERHELSAPVLGKLVFVLPHRRAGSSAHRVDGVVLRQVDDPVVIKRRGLRVGFAAHRVDPFYIELAGVFRRQLAQGAEAAAVPTAVDMEPFVAGQPGQVLIGHARLRGRGQEQRRRCPQ